MMSDIQPTTPTTISSSSTKTTEFKATLPLNSSSISIILTVPTHPNGKIPITLFISDQPANVKLEAYTYTISRDNQSYQTVLNQSASQELMDLTTKLSKAICLKYKTPVYLNLNGDFDPFEYLSLIKLVLDYVESKMPKVI